MPLVFCLTLGATALYAFRLPETYTARAVVQLSPRTTVAGGVVGNETVASAAAGYAAYLGSQATIEKVSEAIGIPAQKIEKGLKIKVLPATTTLTVEYETDLPENAPLTANAMASAAISQAVNDPVATAVLLGKAATPRGPSGPPVKLLLLAGALLALVLAGAVAAILWRLDRSIITSGGADSGSIDGRAMPAEP